MEQLQCNKRTRQETLSTIHFEQAAMVTHIDDRTKCHQVCDTRVKIEREYIMAKQIKKAASKDIIPGCIKSDYILAQGNDLPNR